MNGQAAFVSSFSNISSLGLLSILIQAYPVTLLGYWSWNKLIARYPMSTMAPLTLLVPIFGFAGSIIFYHEPIGLTKLTACAFILTGIAVGIFEPWLHKGKSKLVHR